MKPVSQNNILHENKRSSNTDKKEISVKVRAELLDQDCDLLCNLCHNGHATDVLESGKFYQLQELALHYFCLLFAEAGEQNGEDDEGLNGFLFGDARALVAKSSNSLCFYCHAPGAASRCSAKGCARSFHFPCGLEADAMFQFMGDMDVYCGEHRLKQDIELLKVVPPDYDCVICYDEVGEEVREEERIVVPCCRRHFHRMCVQKMALASGKHHAKCPNCNNNESYVTEIERLGLYIPFADASWETEENSLFYNYGDMYVQERSCGAEECLCTWEGGRSYDGAGGEFLVVLCHYCGTAGVHVKCGQLDMEGPRYVCPDCTEDQNVVEDGGDVVNIDDNQYQVEDIDGVVNNEEVNTNEELNDDEIEIEEEDMQNNEISLVEALVSASLINNVRFDIDPKNKSQAEAIEHTMDITREEVSESILDDVKNSNKGLLCIGTEEGEKSVSSVDITEILDVENILNEGGSISKEEEVNKSQKDDSLETNIYEENTETDSAYEDYKDLIIKYRTVSDDKVSSCLKCGFTVPDNQASDVIKHIKIKHDKLVPKSKKVKQMEELVVTDDIPNQIKRSKVNQEIAVLPYQINAATPSKRNFTTPSHINATTPKQTNPAMQSQINAATQSQINAATPSHTNATTPSPINAATPSQINATTPSHINATTPSQINATTPSQINATTPSPINASTPSLINAAISSRINVAPPSQINAAPPSRINAAALSRINTSEPSQTNAATANQDNVATPSQKKPLKRPFACPVCNSFHKTRLILQLHLANFHFSKTLLNLVFEGSDPLHVCPEQPCSFTHPSKATVAQHLARDHDVVFRIARELFPSFAFYQSATLNKTQKIDSDTSIIKNLAEVIDLIESPPKSGDTVMAKRSLDHIGNETKKAKVNEEPSRKILFPAKKKSSAQTATILPQTRPPQSAPARPQTRPVQTKPDRSQDRNECATLKSVVNPTPTYSVPIQRPMRYPVMYGSPVMMLPPWMDNTEQLLMPSRQMMMPSRQMDNGQIQSQIARSQVSTPAPPYYMAGGMPPRWIPSPMYRHMWYPS